MRKPSAARSRSAERDEPVTELPGHAHDLPPKGGDIDRDRTIEIDDALTRVEKADRPRDVALAVFYRLAAQQPLDGAHIISKLARLHRRKAHGSPAGVSSAETESDTS